MCKSRRPRDGKGKVVWPGAPRRRPTGDRDSLCQTGKDEKGQVVWSVGSRRHPTGGKYSQSGCVSLAGRGMEKVRLSGREHLAGVRREIETRCVRQVKTKKVKLRGRVALADIRREVNTRSLDG